ITQYQSPPTMEYREPIQAGYYLEKWNIQPNQSTGDGHGGTNRQSEAGKYARGIIGEDKYQLNLSYKRKIHGSRYTEITSGERAAIVEYNHIRSEYRDAKGMMDEYITQEEE